jgi:signal transduction histidine kinase
MARSPLSAYALAAFLTGVALLAAATVEPLRERATFLLPLFAVTASAWYVGLLPALLSTALSAMVLGLGGWGSDPTRLAVFCGLAIAIALAAAAERRTREHRERLHDAAGEAERRFAFLAEASSVLGASLDYDVTLASVARQAVPFLADWCTVDLLDPAGGVRRIAVAHGNPAKTELVRAAEVYPPDPLGRHPRTRVLETGRSELIPEISDADLAQITDDPEHLRVIRALGYRSAMIVALSARGQTLGALTFATTDSGRRYGSADLALAEDLARRAALAIDNARLHGEAQAARAEAEAASHAKDEFLGVLSHELRTPLTTAMLWARVLKGGRLAPLRAVHAADMIERSARRQARLIEDLLDVSRIVTGSLRLELRPVELAPPIEAALAAVRPAADEKGIRLTALLSPLTAAVLGDATRLEQVVWNLLANALEFTPDGGWVELRLEEDDGRARIRVSDSGEGIGPDLLPHVFDRFRQADSSSTRRHGGLGLGLAIVRELVALHGGSVRAESAGKGTGATFTVELPLAAEAQARVG